MHQADPIFAGSTRTMARHVSTARAAPWPLPGAPPPPLAPSVAGHDRHHLRSGRRRRGGRRRHRVRNGPRDRHRRRRCQGERHRRGHRQHQHPEAGHARRLVPLRPRGDRLSRAPGRRDHHRPHDRSERLRRLHRRGRLCRGDRDHLPDGDRDLPHPPQGGADRPAEQRDLHLVAVQLGGVGRRRHRAHLRVWNPSSGPSEPPSRCGSC